MKWIKKGLIYAPASVGDWARSHAMAPSVLALNRDVFRVYIGRFDDDGISRIGYVDVDADNPSRILNVSQKPVLDIGRPGTFDDNGVFPASVSRFGKQICLYYTGFQVGGKIRYTMFGGAAVSGDGERFRRVSEAPVMDRSDEGLYFRGGPTVMRHGRKYLAWYSAGSEWEKVSGKARPTYDIYFQASSDPYSFGSLGRTCLRYQRSTEHGIGRPQVIREGGVYRMFYTRRTRDMKYGIGYAESRDGIRWTRKDSAVNLKRSERGWDSKMVYFPCVIRRGRRWFLFYNGNDFGRTGFGYAELEIK